MWQAFHDKVSMDNDRYTAVHLGLLRYGPWTCGTVAVYRMLYFQKHGVLRNKNCQIHQNFGQKFANLLKFAKFDPKKSN